MSIETKPDGVKPKPDGLKSKPDGVQTVCCQGADGLWSAFKIAGIAYDKRDTGKSSGKNKKQ